MSHVIAEFPLDDGMGRITVQDGIPDLAGERDDTTPGVVFEYEDGNTTVACSLAEYEEVMEKMAKCKDGLVFAWMCRAISDFADNSQFDAMTIWRSTGPISPPDSAWPHGFTTWVYLVFVEFRSYRAVYLMWEDENEDYGLGIKDVTDEPAQSMGMFEKVMTHDWPQRPRRGSRRRPRFNRALVEAAKNTEALNEDE